METWWETDEALNHRTLVHKDQKDEDLTAKGPFIHFPLLTAGIEHSEACLYVCLLIPDVINHVQTKI